MKDIFVNFILNTNKDNYDREIIKYGLEVIYLNITKLLIIFGVSILLNVVIETLVVICFLTIIKLFAYGIQMDKSYKCYIFSVIIYCFLPFIVKFIELRVYIPYIFLFSIISFTLFSPSDTKNRPLLKNRLIKKTLSILILLFYFDIIWIFENNKIADYILLSIIIESLIITPFIYKIFGFSYSNYKEVKL